MISPAWRHALPNLAFLAGLGLAVATSMAISGAVVQGPAAVLEPSPQAAAPQPARGIGTVERADAAAAWAYVVANTDPETGLVSAVAGFPSTTMWDQAGAIFALIAAERLELIDRGEFDDRLTRLLASLARLPLFQGKLPNKVYDTHSLEMTDYANTPVDGGIGWSALDVARLMAALAGVVTGYPKYTPQVRAVVSRFDFAALIRDGVLVGAHRDPETGEVTYEQEGRLGYEEYAARAALAFGLDAIKALRIDDYLQLVRIDGLQVPTDSRRREDYNVNRYTLSEPYLLAAFEFGLDHTATELAWRIYAAQEKRFETTGIPTAVSEDHLDREPRFVYATVVGNGEPWAVLDEDGNRHDELRTLSAKAAIGWDALYGTPYTRMLAARARGLRDPEEGWYAGIYEATGDPNTARTLNTNAVILEAVHYRAFGPIISWR